MTDAPPSYDAAIEVTDSSSSSTIGVPVVAVSTGAGVSDEELRVREANVLRREQELAERERKANGLTRTSDRDRSAPKASVPLITTSSGASSTDGVIVTIDTDLKKPAQSSAAPARATPEPPVPEGLELLLQRINTDGNTKYEAITYAVAGNCYSKSCGATLDFVLFEDDRIKATVQFGGPSYSTCCVPCLWPVLPFVASWWYTVRRIGFLIKADEGVPQHEIVDTFGCCGDEKKALFLHGIIQVLWQTGRAESKGELPIYELTGERLVRAVTKYHYFSTFGARALWRKGEDHVGQFVHDFVDRKSERYKRY